jgi:ribonuclease-3
VEGLAALQERLGHTFQVPSLVERALTHASYANEHSPAMDQEPLAFLGDAALSLVVAEQLIAVDMNCPVGVLTPRRAEIVAGANLARWALDLQLGALLRLGRGEDQTGGRTRESILATTLEAVLGVLYLEAGLPAVRRAVERLSGRDANPRGTL